MPLSAGVYEARSFGPAIRVIVANELPQAEHNAMLHLFSARLELLSYAHDHCRPHSQETSSLLYNVLRAYDVEADMPEKLKEFVRQTIDEILATLPAEERLKGLSAEELRKRLPVEERVKGLAAEERLKGLTTEEFVKGLSPETREALTWQLKANGPSAKAP